METAAPADRRHPPTPDIPPDPCDDGYVRWARQALPIFLPVFTLFFVLVAFLSFYLFRDLLHYLTSTWLNHQQRGGGGSTPAAEHRRAGLNPAVLASFPTLPYAAVRGIREGRCGRECAVCLSEFGAGDAVRLLTVCRHAFHPGCIDTWLAAHTTCPVCRSDLEKPPDLEALLAVQEAVDAGEGGSDVALATILEAGEGVGGGGCGGGEGDCGRSRRWVEEDGVEGRYVVTIPESVGIHFQEAAS